MEIKIEKKKVQNIDKYLEYTQMQTGNVKMIDFIQNSTECVIVQCCYGIYAQRQRP